MRFVSGMQPERKHVPEREPLQAGANESGRDTERITGNCYGIGQLRHFGLKCGNPALIVVEDKEGIAASRVYLCQSREFTRAVTLPCQCSCQGAIGIKHKHLWILALADENASITIDRDKSFNPAKDRAVTVSLISEAQGFDQLQAGRRVALPACRATREEHPGSARCENQRGYLKRIRST